jgi:hypothetical protein
MPHFVFFFFFLPLELGIDLCWVYCFYSSVFSLSFIGVDGCVGDSQPGSQPASSRIYESSKQEEGSEERSVNPARTLCESSKNFEMGWEEREG